MPTFASLPLLKNSGGEPAQGIVVLQVTAPFTTADGSLITMAASVGQIVDGRLLAKDASPLSVPVTPTGIAVGMWLKIDESDGTFKRTSDVRWTISVPNVATLSVDNLIHLEPAGLNPDYVIPPMVQALLDSASASASAASTSANNADAARASAVVAKDAAVVAKDSAAASAASVVRGGANGVAPLDANSLLPDANVPTRLAATQLAATIATAVDPIRYASGSTAANSRRFLDRIARGVFNVSLLYVGDSTGNETGEHVYLETIALGKQFPTHTVTIRTWDAAGGLDYAAPVTIQTGIGLRSLTVWNCSVSGESPQYVLGSRWAKAIVQAAPDLTIVSHSHNTGDPGDPTGAFAAHGNRNLFMHLTEELAGAFPAAGIILTAQNPTTMAGRTTWQGQKADALQEISSLRGYGFIDVHKAFVDSGNIAGLLLADGVHPNTAGSKLWADVVMASLGIGGTAASLPIGTPPLLTSTTNHLPNGDFTPWTTASPDGWELTNATTTKETTLYESGAWGARLTPVADGAVQIQRTLSVAAIGNKGIIAGQIITFAVRVYAAPGHTASARITLIDDAGGSFGANTDLGSVRGRYTWLFATKRIADPNNTIYARIIARTSGSASVDFVVDRAYIVRGVLPNVG